MAKPDAPQARNYNRGGSQYIAVGVAILAVALFLGWLATRQPPETVAVTEPGDTTEAATPQPSGPAVDVTTADLANTTRVNELRGQAVRVTGGVLQGLGRQMFWLDAGGQPFPVKLDSALAASGMTAPSSGRYTVEGVLAEKPEALVDSWRTQGVLDSDDQVELAKFGTSYIEARRVTAARN